MANQYEDIQNQPAHQRFKDEWNNEVGRRIQEWASNNGIDVADADFGKLIADAYLEGEFINEDSTSDSRYTGNEAPSWSKPSSGWQNRFSGEGEKLPGDDDGSWDFGGMASDLPGKLGKAAMGAAGAAGEALNYFAGLISPLVMDLDGDGVELLSRANSTAFFDLDNDNFHEHTGWVNNDDGLLARDLNSNGRIDDITELFGNATTDGFIHLDAYDTNNDNLITAADANFASLRVWKDADEDGWTDAGELKTLAQHGITSINLNYTPLTNVTQDGHKISSQSTFAMNGASRSIKDVWFQHDQHLSLYELPANYTYNSAVFTLPSLNGYGNVKDLWVAMSDNASLRSDVTSLVNANYSNFSFSTFQSSVETILLKWAGADTVNPTSRGTNIDARHLVALENLTGTAFNAFGSTSPNPNTGAMLEVRWDEMVTQIATRFLGFIPLKPIVDAYEDVFVALDGVANPQSMTQAQVDALLNPILNPAETAFNAHPLKWAAGLEFDYATDSFTGSLDALVDSLAAQAPAAAAAKQDFWFDKVPLLRSVADSQGLTATQFEAAIAGTYLADFGLTGTQWLSDGVLLGTSGNSTLVGVVADSFSPLGKETLIGGLGNDTLQGGSKDDTYLLRTGDGLDVITDYQLYVGASADKVVFQNVASTAVSLLRSGTSDRDLVINYGTGNQVTLKDQFNEFTSWEIETLQFSDTSWSVADIRARLVMPTSGNDMLIGFRTNDTIDGGLGNDTLKGYEGNDSLIGGSGDDSLVAGTGTDTLIGGIGNDTLIGSGANQSIDGGDGNDLIQASFGADTLLGGAGNDTIESALSGITLLDGGSGNDILKGDTLDNFTGGTGSDTLQFDPGFSIRTTINLATQTASFLNTFYNTTGSFTISGIENVSMMSGDGNDSIIGSVDNNILSSGAGNDTVSAAEGNDSVDAGVGNDTVYGWTGNDTLLGGDGVDALGGDEGNDSLLGGADNDGLYGWTGLDTLIGGAGADYLEGGADADSFKYSALSDSTASTADFIGDFVRGQDKIDLTGLGFTGVTAGAASGTVLGYSVSGGNTTLTNAAGSFVVGVAGNIAFTASDFIFATGGGGSTTPTSGNDSLTGTASADLLDGLAGNDSINGGSGADLLLGSTGDDTLSGSSGSDVLDGGANEDQLTGGSEADFFRFSDTSHSVRTGGFYDRITDFVVGQDKIVLTGLSFTGFDTDGGNTEAGELRLIYSSSSNRTYIRNDQTDFECFLDGDYTATLTASDIVFGNYVVDGTASAETLTGTGLSEVLNGLGGDDTISGSFGNDTLEGGANEDQLSGGSGSDVFKFSATAHSVRTGAFFDRITDFENGSDRIDLAGLGFTGVVTSGAVAGQLRAYYSSGSNRTYVRDDFGSDFEFYLDGNRLSDLDSTDFIFS